MSDLRQTTTKKVVEKPTTFERSDADIVVRMLWYCLDGPKLSSQIVSYCNIDRIQLLRFLQHCIVRGLLKITPDDN